MFWSQLPREVWTIIFEFDPTFHDVFQKNVVKHISTLTSQRLALHYFDEKSISFERTSFRFYQNNTWFTARFTEIEYMKYDVVLWNEKHGTSARHLHQVPGRCFYFVPKCVNNAVLKRLK